MKLESHDTPLGRFIVASGPEFDSPGATMNTPVPGGPIRVGTGGTDPIDRISDSLWSQMGRWLGRIRSEPDPAIAAIRQEAEAAIEELDAAFTRLLDDHIAAIRRAPNRSGAPAPVKPAPTSNPGTDIVDADFRVADPTDKETTNG